jgi:hypothetical protein
VAADPTFYWKQHDTAPAIEGQLTDLDLNEPVDVTGATVTFIMKSVNGTIPKVSASATIVDGPTGLVKYAPIAADTDTAGDYLAEWQVVFGDGSKRTFPNPGYRSVTITADLDNA